MDKRKHEWKWKRVLDGVAESVLEMSDDSIGELVREEGMELEAAADKVRKLLRGADRSFRQQELKRAGEQHRLAVARLSKSKYQLPNTVDAQRAWLFSLLQKNPSLGNGLTLQHREFHEITDAEVEGYLKQLIELGVVDGLADDETNRS